MFESDARTCGFARLEALMPDDGGLVAILERELASAADHDLFRVNPYDFAARCGIELSEAVPLLLSATRAGLMRMEWSLLCRGCGEIAEGHHSLQELEPHFECLACDSRRALTLDESVQVGFTISEDVRALAFHRPMSLPLEDFFFRYKFSTEVLLRGTDRRLVDMISENRCLFTRLEPGAEHVVDLELEPGWVVGSPRAMITVSDEVAEDDAPSEVTLILADTAFEPRPRVRPGPLRVRVKNETGSPQPVLLYFTPEVTHFDYRPFLSGRDVLNTPSFRKHLHTQVVRPGSGLPVVDNTLLFVDFVGSTALYDSLGDDRAFEIVSAHLELLGRLVTRFGGTVVKTIGDAVMASFSRPVDAVGVATRIRDTLAEGRALIGDDPLPTRVGVHRGPCVAVNVGGSIDYFGQTVNIAARLEGAAAANELCITDEVYADEAVRHLIDGCETSREEASLKGVGTVCGLYRVVGV